MSDKIISLLIVIGAIIGSALTGVGVEALRTWYQRRKENRQALSLRDRQSQDASLQTDERLWRRVEQLEAKCVAQAEELETVREQRRRDVLKLEMDALNRQDEYYRKHRDLERRCEALEETNQDLSEERDRCNKQVDSLKLKLAKLEEGLSEVKAQKD